MHLSSNTRKKKKNVFNIREKQLRSGIFFIGWRGFVPNGISHIHGVIQNKTEKL